MSWRYLALCTGGEARVSESDYHWLCQRRWYSNARGYATCDLFGGKGGIKVLMHRLILLAPDTATVDHINGDTLDNRRENLRLATRSQQNANRPKFKGASRFRGVFRRCDGLKWVAQCKNPATGKKLSLGSFEREEDAAFAYDAAARAHYGEFACVNFPLPGERAAVKLDRDETKGA